MNEQDPAANITIHRIRDVLVVEVLSPDLDARLGSVAAREGTEAMESIGIRLRGVVLDLTAVNFMNSGGLAACIDVAKQAKRAGVGCVGAGLGEELERLITVMKVESLIAIGGTRDEAIRSLA
ncbi:MAG: STAS domain-containing protein [Phycisphaerales bacterium]